MQDDVIIGKGSGFPDLKQGIGIQEITVYSKGNIGTVCGVVLSHIGTQPALQPPTFIIVGPGAFFFKFISRFKAVDKKIPDIFPGFAKAFDQFMKI